MPQNKVSVILSLYNEDYEILKNCLLSVVEQSYPSFEIIIVYFLEDDLVKLNLIIQDLNLKKHARTVKFLKSNTKNLPHNLNQAIKESSGEFIVRVDSHSFLQQNYIKLSIKKLLYFKADVVGGSMLPISTSTKKLEVAIAKAMSTGASSGFSLYRFIQHKIYACRSNSVYLGVYRKSVFKKYKYFDETLKRGQDWELNNRINRSGGTVYFISNLQTLYSGRKNLQDLIKQQFITGFYRELILNREKSKLKIECRYGALPIFFLFTSLLMLENLWFSKALAFILIICYISVIVASLLKEKQITVIYHESLKNYIYNKGEGSGNVVIFLIAIFCIITIHLAWSIGYITGAFIPRSKK